MENSSDQDMPALRIAQILTLILLCAVGVTASYVESISPKITSLLSSPIKP